MLNSLGLRRKSNRAAVQNGNGTLSAEPASVYDDDHLQSPKMYLIPTKSLSSTSAPKKNPVSNLPPTQPVVEDPPASLSTRKRWSRKKNVPAGSKPSTMAAPQEQATANNTVPSRTELSTSLADLMGITSTTASVTSPRQIHVPPSQQLRTSRRTVLNFFQHIVSTPNPTVDRSEFSDSATDASGSAMFGSQRTTGAVNHPSNAPLSTSHIKLITEYTWCQETGSLTSTEDKSNLDECFSTLEIDRKPLTYRQQFESTEHFNWYGIGEFSGPLIISYKYLLDQNKQRCIMGIVRSRQRTSIETLTDAPSSWSSNDILRRLCEQCHLSDLEYFDPILCSGTHDLLKKYDESLECSQHKFGIIYQRENQLTEEEIFSNETHSRAMDKFLALIGHRVKLKDFRGFRGGLDVKSDHTGVESIYERYHNHEIMFHVSTLLPHSKIERQQLERKRHIGNDIVTIIFQETDTPFNPECITSQFLHVYLIVTPVNDEGTLLKVSVIHRDSVSPFGPVIPQSQTFACDATFKHWLLTKLINAEIAACRSNSFQRFQERTKTTLFDDLYRQLHENNRPFMSHVLHFSQYKHECDVEQQVINRKEGSPIFTSTKTLDRHADSSLLGSVRRRFIAPKLRPMNSPTPSSMSMSTPSPPGNTNEAKSSRRSMIIHLKENPSKEHVTVNGHAREKLTAMFSGPKSNRDRVDKSTLSCSPQETDESSVLASAQMLGNLSSSPPDPSTGSNAQNDLLSPSYPNPSSVEDIDNEMDAQVLPDDLQSSSKDDLIKYIVALQQHHSAKVTQKQQIHSTLMKQLEIQRPQKPSSFDNQ